MLKEFREFAVKGNMVDMAVGIVIGGAFSRIVTSLVNDVIMPPLGMVLGKMDFSNLFLNLSGQDYRSLTEARAAGAATVNYGVFLNNILDFLIVAFALFMVIRQLNRLRAKPQPGPVTTKKCKYCISSVPIEAVRCPNCTSDLK